MSERKDWAHRISGLHPVVVLTPYVVCATLPVLTIYGPGNIVDLAFSLLSLLYVFLGGWLLAIYVVSTRLLRSRGRKSGYWWPVHLLTMAGGALLGLFYGFSYVGPGSETVAMIAIFMTVIGYFASCIVTAAALQAAGRADRGNAGYAILYSLGFLYLIIGLWFLWPVIKRVRSEPQRPDEMVAELI